MEYNKALIALKHYYHCNVCNETDVKEQRAIMVMFYPDYTKAVQAGWIFSRENNKTVAYCPKCRRLSENA